MGGERHRGARLCGKVRVTVTGERDAPFACHGVQRRQQSGHVIACVNVMHAQSKRAGDDRLRGFQPSPKVRRGFGTNCGS